MLASKKLIRISLFVSICLTCLLCMYTQSSATETGPLTPEQVETWRADLAYLSEQLPVLHYDAFHKISEQEFEEAVTKLDTDLPNLKQHEVIVRLAQIVAMIGDGHTTLGMQKVGFKVFPVLVWWFADGPYVIQTTSDYEDLLGQRVLEVNGVPIERAMNLVGSMFAWENESQLHKEMPLRLVQAEVLDALGLAQSPDLTAITVADGQGEEIVIDVKAVEFSPKLDWKMAGPGIPGFTCPFGEIYEFVWDQDTGVLLLRYNVCMERDDLPFTKFEQNFLNAIEEYNPTRIVIDLRNNGGGNSGIMDPLIQKLSTMREVNQPGKLYVLIGRATFSSAVLNAMSFRNDTTAILLGEPSGGKPNHYGEILSFKLPNSELAVQYSTKYFVTTEGDPDAIYPDIEATQSYADYLDGYDPALALAADGVQP